MILHVIRSDAMFITYCNYRIAFTCQKAQRRHGGWPHVKAQRLWKEGLTVNLRNQGLKHGGGITRGCN